jgi:hypothetical protein
MANPADFNTWKTQLEAVWHLKSESDDVVFYALMDGINGKEALCYFDALIETVRLKEDNGVYESLWNAIWAFPAATVGEQLAKHLPDFQKRMGKYDQVSRFYLPILNRKSAQKSFLKQSDMWNAAEKKTAINALKDWAVEDAAWESILAQLGTETKTLGEDAIPAEWPEAWQTRLAKARKSKDEYNISGLFWNGSKKRWLEDLDFLIEILAMNHGKNWRQIDAMTNPLFVSFAKTTVYPEFLNRFKLLPQPKQDKILANIKKVKMGKYNSLVEDLRS